MDLRYENFILPASPNIAREKAENGYLRLKKPHKMGLPKTLYEALERLQKVAL